MTTHQIPATLTITHAQETALENMLAALEHDVNALVYAHLGMLSTGGWTRPKNIALNKLSETDIRAVYSPDCRVTVLPPESLKLTQQANGYPLTQEQVDAIEAWFAAPEHQNRTREDFLQLVVFNKLPESLNSVKHIKPSDMAVVLYACYKPIENEVQSHDE